MNQSMIRQAIFEVSIELARQGMRLAEIASEVQLPRDFELDVELPNTVEIELFSRIQAVKKDYIQPGTEALMAAIQVTDSELRPTVTTSDRARFSETALARRIDKLMQGRAPRFSESLQESLARRAAELLSKEGDE
jgi:hypothetical protein